METIGDIVRLRDEYGENAYQLALVQLAGTGLDIMASSVALQNLCIVYILKKGYGVAGLVSMFDVLYGKNDYNAQRAERNYSQAQRINIV